jgi:hypothetical protein
VRPQVELFRAPGRTPGSRFAIQAINDAKAFRARRGPAERAAVPMFEVAIMAREKRAGDESSIW